MPIDPSSASVRVAVVDDEPTVASTVSRLFRAQGWEVRVHNDPLEALGNLVADPPEVLVVDYDMPGLTGAGLVRRFRERIKGVSAPALLVTGNRGGVPVEDRAPFEAILEKPFDPSRLVELVEYCALVRRKASDRSGTRRRASVSFDRVEDPGRAKGATGEHSTE